MTVTPALKKYVMDNLPYLMFLWFFAKLAEAYRIAPGADIGVKLMGSMKTLGAVIASPFSGFTAQDLLIAAIAYAAATQWDIQSFVRRWFGAKITEEGQQALQTMKPGAYTAENEEVTVTVRQAIYDGDTLYVMLAATPKHPEKALLLLLDSLVDDPVCNLGLPEHENDLTPIKDSELAKGKILLGVEPVVFVNGNGSDLGNGDQKIEADGTMVSWIEAHISVADDVEEVKVSCDTYLSDKQADPENMEIRKINFTFPLKVTRLEQSPVVWPIPEGE